MDSRTVQHLTCRRDYSGTPCYVETPENRWIYNRNRSYGLVEVWAYSMCARRANSEFAKSSVSIRAQPLISRRATNVNLSPLSHLCRTALCGCFDGWAPRAHELHHGVRSQRPAAIIISSAWSAAAQPPPMSRRRRPRDCGAYFGRRGGITPRPLVMWRLLLATLPLVARGVDLTLYGGAFESSTTTAYAEVCTYVPGTALDGRMVHTSYTNKERSNTNVNHISVPTHTSQY